MGEYFQEFCKLMGVKTHPSDYEKSLFEKTVKYSKYISWIPGLKMVAICNSLSMYATKPSPPTPLHELRGEHGSDIDLFIITAPKRLWYVRIMITTIFQFLGVRRHGNKVKDRFCLSFFITENAMDFSSFAIEKDIYLFYWIYYLKPIINKDSTYEKFIKANKSLGIDEINLHSDNKVYLIKNNSSAPMSFLRKQESTNYISNQIGNFLNYILKKIFLPKTLAHKKRLGDPFGLIVSDDILKFHDNDRREGIRDGLI